MPIIVVQVDKRRGAPYENNSGQFLGDDTTANRLNPQELMGTLPHLITKASDYAWQYTGVHSRIEGLVRQDTLLYPRAVVREAIVNAVARRDYSIAGSQTRLFTII